MKLAFVTSAGGGLDSYVRTMSHYLAEYGHTIHVVQFGSAPPWTEKSSNVYFHPVKTGSLHYYIARIGFKKTYFPLQVRMYEQSLAAAKVLRKIASYQGIDLVEFPETITHPRLFRGLPYIVKLHGADWVFRHYCEDGPYYRFQIHAQRRMLLGARQIHSPSRSLADFVAGACDIPRRMIHITPHPIAREYFCQFRSTPHGPPWRIISVGRLERRKGTHTLIKALREVWKQNPDVHIHLYGADGDFGRSQIETVLPDSEHEGRIHFEGFADRERLIEGYQKAHVSVLASRYENSPLVILEAMAAGLPIIATDIGGIPELIKEKINGWLVARDDVNALAQAILQAFCDPYQLEAFRRLSSLFAAQFEAERVIPRQISLYEQALNSDIGVQCI